jgi:hypothetical protein
LGYPVYIIPTYVHLEQIQTPAIGGEGLQNWSLVILHRERTNKILRKRICAAARDPRDGLSSIRVKWFCVPLSPSFAAFFFTRLLQRHQQHRRSFTTNHSDYANEKCVCHGPTPIYYLIMTVVCELVLMLGNYLCIRHNLCYRISSLPNYQHAACPNSEQRGCLVCRGSK